MLKLIIQSILPILIVGMVCGAVLFLKYYMLYRAPELNRSALLDQREWDTEETVVAAQQTRPR